MYLKIYKRWYKAGRMPEAGLCRIFSKYAEFDFIRPSDYEWNQFRRTETHGYWGSGIHESTAKYQFTPLRQNLVLLMACLNGEL